MHIIEALNALRERANAPIDLTQKYTRSGWPIVPHPPVRSGEWPSQKPNDIPPGFNWRDHENEYD